MSTESERMMIARVIVERHIHADGSDIVTSWSHNGDGEDLPLITTLGMLEMAKDTAIRSAMGEVPEDGDE